MCRGKKKAEEEEEEQSGKVLLMKLGVDSGEELSAEMEELLRRVMEMDLQEEEEEEEEGEGMEGVRGAFTMYEEDHGCGRITPNSLKRMLSKLGDKRSVGECKQMISAFDLDRDGVLSFHEFKLMFSS